MSSNDGIMSTSVNKTLDKSKSDFTELYAKSKVLIDNARNSMGVFVNAMTVYTSFLLGKYMLEEEQNGNERAKYGAKVLDSLSAKKWNCPIGDWTIRDRLSKFSV